MSIEIKTFKGLNLKKRARLWCLTLALIQGLCFSVAHAVTLPKGHFLYPMDFEYLLYSAIEGLPSEKSIQKILFECNNKSPIVLVSYVAEETIKRDQFLCHLLQKGKMESWNQRRSEAFWNPGTQILYFGENHLHIDSHKEFAGLFSAFAKDGFKTLAMEMFPYSEQKNLDAFFKGEINLEKILAILKKHWTYSQEGYAEILKAAVENGVRIIGIDQRDSEQPRDLLLNISARDEIMADQLSQHIKSHPQEKILVYVGSLHAPLKFSQQSLVPSQIERLKIKLMQSKINPPQIETYSFKRADRNPLYKALSSVYSLSGEDVIFYNEGGALIYGHGLIFINKKTEL